MFESVFYFKDVTTYHIFMFYTILFHVRQTDNNISYSNLSIKLSYINLFVLLSGHYIITHFVFLLWTHFLFSFFLCLQNKNTSSPSLFYFSISWKTYPKLT